jgi:hypothetical protein
MSKEAIHSFRRDHKSALNLAALGARRADAAQKLMSRAFHAKRSKAEKDSSLDRSVDLVERFLEHQLELCRAGTKPVAAC